MMPDRPKNHKQPMKRTRESAAVAQSRAWKKRAVRSEELDWSTKRISNFGRREVQGGGESLHSELEN